MTAPGKARLVPPERARRVTCRLDGWPASASALLDLLNRRLARRQVLGIASWDPFGADEHFPVLAKIWASGRVPDRLGFHPGEALRLARWSTGPTVDHLARAWCCAVLCISPDDTDQLADVVAPLVESCLAIGGEAPEAAEQLLVWRATSAVPGQVGPAAPDPVALLAVLLLGTATDPGDARLPALCDTVATAIAGPPRGSWHEAPARQVATCGSAPLWRHLIGSILRGPTAMPTASAVLDALDGAAPE
jgi:hypothetical protein